MTVIYQDDYSIPVGGYPLTHSRILYGPIAAGTVTAQAALEGYYETAPTYSTTDQLYAPDGYSGDDFAYWDYDFDAGQEIDCICIAAHNLGTNGSTLKVIASLDAVETILYEDTVADDSPVMVIFEPRDVDQIRIAVTAGDDFPYFGVVKAGVSLQMPRPFYGGHTPMDFGRNVTITPSHSALGEFLGKTKIKVNLSTSYEWRHLNPYWMRTTWYPFQLAIEDDTFFIAWRPQPRSAQENEVAYVIDAQIATAPTNMGVGDGLMNVSIQATARSWE